MKERHWSIIYLVFFQSCDNLLSAEGECDPFVRDKRLGEYLLQIAYIKLTFKPIKKKIVSNADYFHLQTHSNFLK